MKSEQVKKLGLFGLIAVVISSMMGSGVYSLPQNMAAAASVDAILIAWLITGIGMYFIADTFKILSIIKPHLTSGVYTYAQDGFGTAVGFGVAWGYWLCNIFANIGMSVILMETLNYFFPPHFVGGNNINSLIGTSIIIWFFTLLVWRGIQTAAIVNLIGTVIKLVPIFAFIAIAVFAFSFAKFDMDLIGKIPLADWDYKGLLIQVKNTMLVTLWAFIGIESAVMLSHRARSQKDVARATVLGLMICIVCYALISILPFGILERGEIIDFKNPSTAGILAHILGTKGAWIMNIGLIVSVLFAFLSWVIISIEIPFIAAKNGAFPKQFARENSKGTPSYSLFLTAISMQLALLLAYSSTNAWGTMISITGVMVMPVYLVSALYLFKNNNLTKHGIGRTHLIITSTCGVIYAIWLIYAANVKYLLMATAFFLLGVPVYLLARKQAKKMRRLSAQQQAQGDVPAQ